MLDIKSETERKRVVLLSRLSLLIFILTSIYLALDLLLGVYAQKFLYIGFFGFSLLVYFLNRLGRTEIAKVLGLFVFNIMLYVVASSEPFETGISLYMFAAGAVALTIYDFKDWPKSLFFATLSMILMILVYLGDVSIVEHRHFSPYQTKFFFVVNATINGAVCIYSFLLFSKLNYQAEAKLRENEKLMQEQNEQLLKANKELDRFVYSVSHDLRAPLSSISGLVHLIENSKEPKETTQYLGLIKGRIIRLEQFIRDIIDFSRNARSEIKLEQVNLKELADEIFETLKFNNGADCIEMENELENTFVTITDKARLQIVLFNLISNAIQYRDLKKNRSYIKISKAEKEGSLILNLDDNGIGIDPQHHTKVYNMFYRASENSKGSGLGLYIAKETMDKLGGTISLQSVLGQGTRFSLELPFKGI